MNADRGIHIERERNAKAAPAFTARPRLSELRESGSIEQDADLVGREEYYADTDEDKKPPKVKPPSSSPGSGTAPSAT